MGRCRSARWMPVIGAVSFADIVHAVNLLMMGYLLTFVPLLCHRGPKKRGVCWCFLTASLILVVGIDVCAGRAAWLAIQPFMGPDGIPPR